MQGCKHEHIKIVSVYTLVLLTVNVSKLLSAIAQQVRVCPYSSAHSAAVAQR